MIKHLSAVLVVAMADPTSAAAPSPLAVYKGVARVLVLSAPSPNNSAMATQNQWLLTQKAGLRERDVAVIRIIGDVVTGPPDSSTDARAWRDAAAIPTRQFTVTLIGKDGTRAFAERRPIKAVELFRRIDAMPMRLEEMAHRTR